MPGGVPSKEPIVFLSYAHDDETHVAAVHKLASLLQARGVVLEYDRIRDDVRRDWYAWMLRVIQESDYTVVIGSPMYQAVGDGNASSDLHRGVQAEAAVLRDLVYRDRRSWVGRILPVLLPGRTVDDLPAFIQPYTASRYPIRSITDEGIADLLRVLTGTPGPRAPLTRRPAIERWQRAAYVNHDQLIGADNLVELIAGSLDNAPLDRVTSVVGDGGIGKTAVAYEAVRAATASGRFTRVAWVSAFNPHEDDPQPVPVSSGPTYWVDILKEIGDQLDFDLGLSRALWRNEFENRLAALPDGEQVLIVVDNLETLPDTADAVLQLQALGVRAPHQLLVTTRWELQQNLSRVVEFRVRPLKVEDALHLVRHLGADDPGLRQADDRLLTPVLDATEGNPFLIKLIVQQYLSSHRPLDRVMDELRRVRSDQEGLDNLASRVRTYLYTNSLLELEHRHGEEYADALLAAFCIKGRGDAFDYDELADVSGIDDADAFASVLTTACQLSLVTSFGDVSAGVLGRRYTIHSLLYDFTCGPE